MVTTSPGYVALLLVIICAPCRAQEHSAALAGAVHGQGALLPHVTARLLAENFNQVLATSVTGSDGRFAFSGLPCGDSYTLTFSSAGWETRRLPHLQLRCDSTLHLGVVLKSSVEPPRHLAPPEISDQCALVGHTVWRVADRGPAQHSQYLVPSADAGNLDSH